MREWRVSSQAIRSAERRVSTARNVISPRLPIGVGTKMTLGGGVSCFLDAIGKASDDGFGRPFKSVGKGVDPGGLEVVIDEEA